MKKILSLFLFLISNNIFPQDIKCFILEPPEQTLSGIKKIAVMDFNGSYGRAIADYLISALLEDKRGITTIKGGLFKKDIEGKTYLNGAKTNIFTIVERSRLEQVLSEQSISTSGIVDENQAVKLGKVLGVDAIINGTVNPIANDTKTREEIQVYRDNKWIKVMGDCITRNISVEARMRIVNVNTGQIVGTKEAAFKITDKKCGDEIAQLTNTEDLIKQCLQATVYQDLINYLAPRFVLWEYELKEIDVDEYEKLSDKAIEAAEAGNFDQAYMIYASILKEDSYNDVAKYNVGVLNELMGNFQEAHEAYQFALNVKQEKDYTEALKHCQRINAFNSTLKDIGIIITPYKFAVSEEQMKSATAKKVKLRGSSSDRIILRATAETSGAAVAKVPGGIELELIEQNGAWYKVKTFDGKIGFVNKDDLD